MRTFLRHIATGHYFRAPERWTLDRDDAYDFEFVGKAMKTAHKLHIRDLELVLAFEDPAEAAATPFTKFLRRLSRSRKNPALSGKSSRSAALT